MTNKNVHTLNLIFQLPFHESADLNEIFNNYKENMSDLSDSDKKNVYQIFKGVGQNYKEIDEIISNNTNNWSINRLEKEVLAILRISTYELKYTNIPYKISIDKAVSLAKDYTNEKTAKFINGVLASILKECRENE